MIIESMSKGTIAVQIEVMYLEAEGYLKQYYNHEGKEYSKLFKSCINEALYGIGLLIPESIEAVKTFKNDIGDYGALEDFFKSFKDVAGKYTVDFKCLQY